MPTGSKSGTCRRKGSSGFSKTPLPAALRFVKKLPFKLFFLVLLLISLLSFQVVRFPRHAYAVESQPPTITSYYVTSNDTDVAGALGCTQAETDTSNSVTLSSVILDFGGQADDGSGAYLPGTTTFISNADMQSVADAYATGYYACSPSEGPTHYLDLYLGTNNSTSGVTYDNGGAWATLVDGTQTYVCDEFDACGNTFVQGASDIEPSWSSASDAEDWTNGFQNGGYWADDSYINFGSADGCPSDSYSNGSCNNGWHQYDEWYVSIGNVSAFAGVPEIYYSVNAEQWAMISKYGYESQAHTVWFQGPLDEHELDGSTLSSADAWNDFWTDLNNDPDSAQDLNWSAEINWEPTE